MTELKELAGLLGVPFVIALVEATKRVAQPSDRWLPLIAVFWGIALNLALAWILGNPYPSAIIWGVVAGMGAIGLFSGTRATLGG